MGTKGKTEKAAPAADKTSNPLLDQKFKMGKPYNVRPNTAQNNAKSWEVLTKVVADNGGTATRAQLLEAMKPFNHTPMVGYAIRRGWLAEDKA